MLRKLTISITLRDDAMTTKNDVYDAISGVIGYWAEDTESWAVIPGFWQPVEGVNGNVSGFCQLTGGE